MPPNQRFLWEKKAKCKFLSSVALKTPGETLCVNGEGPDCDVQSSGAFSPSLTGVSTQHMSVWCVAGGLADFSPLNGTG